MEKTIPAQCLRIGDTVKTKLIDFHVTQVRVVNKTVAVSFAGRAQAALYGRNDPVRIER